MRLFITPSVLLLLGISAGAARACALALVLAVDVSGSVDAREYRIQMQGLAEALRDGIVIEALVSQQAALTLIQWTGASRQRQTLPWARMHSADDVLRFAERVEADQRIWHNYSTAIGEALGAAGQALRAVPECARKVIDISGDGLSNEGILPRLHHPALRARGVVVNALAIETTQEDLTAWYFENVILGGGAFVMTARGFQDYPEQIRRKLRRETTRQLSVLP